MGLLKTIRCPVDVRELGYEQLPELAAEIREFLVAAVSRTGGHLGPNLGVVELTVALHSVFDSPKDRILSDTGHQAYVHKMLTGRREGFAHLRQRDGISGYLSQSESEHDVIDNSHASTTLSYADGLAKAYWLRGDNHRSVVAVVGDGALTGGMCWEALNRSAYPRASSVTAIVTRSSPISALTADIATDISQMVRRSLDAVGQSITHDSERKSSMRHESLLTGAQTHHRRP